MVGCSGRVKGEMEGEGDEARASESKQGLPADKHCSGCRWANSAQGQMAQRDV